MNIIIRHACEREFELADLAIAGGDLPRAFRHLERAHILGQRNTITHVRSHWRMLRLGWRVSDAREIRGQIPRVIAALLFSRIWVPTGNTGGANVSAFRSMPIPADLAALLRKPAVPVTQCSRRPPDPSCR